MGAVRSHLLLGCILIAAAGCAQQPERAANAVPSAAATTAPTATSSATTTASTQKTSSSVSPRLMAFARDEGYRPRNSGGNTYFCKTETPTGALIPRTFCLNESEMQFKWIQHQQQQQRLTAPIVQGVPAPP